MGKLMTSILKTKAAKLKDMYPTEFTSDFEHNKKVLDNLGFFAYSKSDRNHIAGYIATMKKAEAKEE